MRKSNAAQRSSPPVASVRAKPVAGRPSVSGGWFSRRSKPATGPTGPVFDLAWTIMDGLLWFSGYRLFNNPPGPRRNLAVGCWGLTMLGVGGFQYVLFGRKHLAEAGGVTAGLVASSTALVGAAATVDRQAARAAVPLAVWVTAVFLLQQDRHRGQKTAQRL